MKELSHPGTTAKCAVDLNHLIIGRIGTVRAFLRRMSSQKICIGVNRLHRFRSRPRGASLSAANCVLTSFANGDSAHYPVTPSQAGPYDSQSQIQIIKGPLLILLEIWPLWSAESVDY